MSKSFNTQGTCLPANDYMVDISEKIQQITELVDNGKYFTINRARQFGKTTTLAALFNKLSDRYLIFKISFEICDSMFDSPKSFCHKLCLKLANAIKVSEADKEYWNQVASSVSDTEELAFAINKFCKNSSKKVLLLIDEVDKSSDNQLFLNFLGMLRNRYLERNETGDVHSTFYSVVLAGVYDIKNLKLKLRADDEKKYNSPWNIAVDFLVDMSFSPKEISTMLIDYENDHQTGMDIDLMSNEIHKYTSGYPYLVSKICEIIDQRLNREWTVIGIQKAVKEIVRGENITLIDDISKNLENNAELRDFMYEVTINGQEFSYNFVDPMVKLASLFSYIKNQNGVAVIHNLVFDEVFHQYFTLAYQRKNAKKLNVSKSDYIIDGRLNMPYVIERFQQLLREEYRKESEDFIESQGRLLFLCFLKPIINGTGFYYVEPQTRSNRRMDVVVTYGDEEFVIELKIWRGAKYETDGKEQLADYLATRNLSKGYLITFSFLKNKGLQSCPQWVERQGKQIYEAII